MVLRREMVLCYFTALEALSSSPQADRGRYRVTALLLKLAMKLTLSDCGSSCHNVMCLQLDLDRWLNSVFLLSLSITTSPTTTYFKIALISSKHLEKIITFLFAGLHPITHQSSFLFTKGFSSLFHMMQKKIINSLC